MSGIKRIYSPSSDTELDYPKRVDIRSSPVKMCDINEWEELETGYGRTE